MNGYRRHDVPSEPTLAFFTSRMTENNAVQSAHELGGYCYSIGRIGRPGLTAFVTDIYIIGEAEASEILHLHPDIDVIVTLSPYNSYTKDAKEYCLDRRVGLFKFREFMGAVNYTESNFLDYVLPDERDQQYWTKKLRSLLAQKKRVGLDGVSVYLFGSGVKEAHPNDLDLLLVYDEKVMSSLQIRNLRDTIRKIVEANTRLKTDVCMLSHKEARSSQFIQEEHAVKLFP